MKTFLSYALAFGGLALLALTIARAFASNLSYMAGRLLLTNLLRTNANQAEVVCRATPNTFFQPIGAAIKTCAMTKSTDPAVLAQASRPTYDAIATVVALHWKQLVGKAKLPVLAAVGGLALAISSDAMPIALVVIFGLVIATGVIALLVRKAEVERSIILARAEVLPEVDRAFVEGRYR